tara:strand:- start:293 stop:502 length:210 start_codon:yes stop_codon:yes gene_type:complete
MDALANELELLTGELEVEKTILAIKAREASDNEKKLVALFFLLGLKDIYGMHGFIFKIYKMTMYFLFFF